MVEGDAPVVTPDAIDAPALPDTAEFLTQRAMVVQPTAEPALPVVEAALPLALQHARCVHAVSVGIVAAARPLAH